MGERKKQHFNDSLEDQTSQKAEALSHSKSYSELLNIYVKSVEKNINTKNRLKWIFFILTMGSMLAVIAFFFVSMDYAFTIFSESKSLDSISYKTILSMATILIPTISSVIVALIKIPKIIAQYLFDTQEDQYMNSVVKNIQDYDKEILEIEYKIKNVLSVNKEPRQDDQFQVPLKSMRNEQEK